LIGISGDKLSKYSSLSRYLPAGITLTQRITDGWLGTTNRNLHVSSSSDGKLEYWILSSLPVGIDAEPLRLERRFTWSVARRVVLRFAEDEQRYLQSTSGTLRDTRLLTLWTSKEAVAKCVDCSLLAALSTSTISENENVRIIPFGNKLLLLLSLPIDRSIISICYDVTHKYGGTGMDKQNIESGVISIVTDYLESTNQSTDSLSRHTTLVGSDAIVTSVGLVTIIMDLEAWLAEQGVDVSLTSEKAMSSSRSPFRSIESLVEYVVEEQQSGE